MPIFRHAWPELSGETGYLARVGGLDDPVLSEESVVFRPTSLADDPLATTADPRARVMADMARGLIPDLGISGLEPVHTTPSSTPGRSVGSARGRGTSPRCPGTTRPSWSCPSAGARCSATPAGCGIHDRDGYPCVVRAVAVQVTLGRTLLDAVERIAQSASTGAGPRADDVRLVRLLAWNAWRIVPGVYQSLLTCLVPACSGTRTRSPCSSSTRPPARDGREDTHLAPDAEFLAERRTSAGRGAARAAPRAGRRAGPPAQDRHALRGRGPLPAVRAPAEAGQPPVPSPAQHDGTNRIAELMVTGSFPSPRRKGDPSRLGASDRVHIANSINHAKGLILRSIDEAVMLIGSLSSNTDRRIDPGIVLPVLAKATKEYADEVETSSPRSRGP